MHQKRYPQQLWQHEESREREIPRGLSWGLVLLICVGVWVAINYGVWRFFFA